MEILLYSNITNYSAERFISDLEANKGQEVILRLNTDGGSPESAFGMIAKFSEHTGRKTIKVDGKAYSMGTFFLAYSKDNEALDVSEFLIHRAAYPKNYEQSPMMTQEAWGNLNRINSHLRKALESRINVSTLRRLKGVSLDEIFSNDQRIDVFLSAQEALTIGLVDRIVEITPERKAEIDSRMQAIAAQITVFHNPTISPREKSEKFLREFKNEFSKQLSEKESSLEASRAKVYALLGLKNYQPISHHSEHKSAISLDLKGPSLDMQSLEVTKAKINKALGIQLK